MRFFLLREIPFGQDGSYSTEGIVARINADLANEFGNLAQRSLSMVAKNLEATVPQPGDVSAADRELLTLADELARRGALGGVRGKEDRSQRVKARGTARGDGGRPHRRRV